MDSNAQIQGANLANETMDRYETTCSRSDISDAFNFLMEIHNESLQRGLDACGWLIQNFNTSTSSTSISVFRAGTCEIEILHAIENWMQSVASCLEKPKTQNDLSNQGMVFQQIVQRGEASDSLQDSLEGLYPVVFPSGADVIREGCQQYCADFMLGYLAQMDMPTDGFD